MFSLSLLIIGSRRIVAVSLFGMYILVSPRSRMRGAKAGQQSASGQTVVGEASRVV